ncbi:GAF domain-containing protein [Candidatus Sumerlaeota bacterium]|nr:GAF domain-containing protein [Candidatus Sumerlaeota bacterium]
MKPPFVNSLYHKTILLVIFTALAPAIIGTMIFLFGAKELVSRDTAQRMQVLAAQFNDFVSQTIEDLAAQSSRLYQAPAIPETFAELDKQLNDPGAASALTTDTIKRVEYLEQRLNEQLAEKSALQNAQTVVFHRSRAEPVVSINAVNPAELARVFQSTRDSVALDMNWQVYDTRDPQYPNRYYVFFLCSVNGGTIKNADFISVSMLDVEALFPFIHSSSRPENITLSLWSDRGYILLRSVDFNDALLDQSPYQYFGSENIEGVIPLDVRLYGPHALMVWRKISALRIRRGENDGGSLQSDWLICMIGDMTESQTLLIWLYWRVAITIGALILGMCALSILLTRRLVRPIVKLTEAAEAMSAGEAQKIKSLPSFNDEVERLTQSFNAMVERLESSYGELRESLDNSRKQADQLELLQDITNAINTKLHLDETLMTTMRELHRLAQFDAAAISIFDDETQRLSIKMTYPNNGAGMEESGNIAMLTGGNSRWVIEHRKPLIHLEPAEENTGMDANATAAPQDGIRAFIILPLISSSGVIGTFGIGRAEPLEYTENQAGVLMRLANSLAVAIEHSRLYDRVSDFAEELEHKIEQRTNELQAAHNKLIETEKLAATGRLAGTLAHEVNNPLGIIKNYLKIVIDQVSAASGGRRASDPNMEHLLIMQEELDRIARIVRNLMDFYKPSRGVHQAVDLQEAMDQILRLLERDWEKRNIHIEKRYRDNLPATFCSPDLIRQVFVNLLRNAEDAMNVDGKLTIEVEVVPDSRSGQSGQAIRIQIRDTGCGIPPEVMPQIFDPFFTTKKEQQGTGLGLSVTYSIMRSFDGAIDVQSEHGRGTAVTLLFPVIKPDESQPPPASSKIILG